MESVTYPQLQDLISRLPETKLMLAYSILQYLIENNEYDSSPQLRYLSLPLDEKRTLLKRQAEAMVTHYNSTEFERLDWQSGEFLDAY